MTVDDLRIDIGPGLRKLDVYARREVLSKTNEGDLSTSFKGRGIEFSGFRRYNPGDDAQRIDWKASLRAQDVLIREFEEYRNTTIFFLFDVSNSMLFGSGDKLKCEYAAESIYLMIDAMLKSGDSVGLGMFSDDLKVTILPEMGRSVLNHIGSSLLKNDNYGGEFNIEKALSMSKSLLGERAVIVIVSDFLGLKKGWEKYIRMFDQSFELIAFMVRDPRDLELPVQSGRYLFKDPYSEENIYIDAKKYAPEYKKLVEKDIDYLKSIFRQSKGDFLLLRTDEDFIDKTVMFFNKRLHRG